MSASGGCLAETIETVHTTRESAIIGIGWSLPRTLRYNCERFFAALSHWFYARNRKRAFVTPFDFAARLRFRASPALFSQLFL